MGDESRARILMALMDARARTATEMAECADISRGTATTHLNHLVGLGLLEEVRQGRHRYVRLKSADVADAIEALVRLSPQTGPQFPSTYRARKHELELQQGRTCYRHLAGVLGVRLQLELKKKGLVSPGWELTAAGREWACSLGIDLPENSTRALIRPCLDWTERVDHAAGLLPDLLVTTSLDHGWLKRGSHRRSIILTPQGAARFAQSGLSLDLIAT